MLQVLDHDSSKIINILNQDPSGVRLTKAEVLYVDYIVSNLKVIGVWTKIKALYGFVGGNAWKHKWNWKDMRDLDEAFRIDFSLGGFTHSHLGIEKTNPVVNNLPAVIYFSADRDLPSYLSSLSHGFYSNKRNTLNVIGITAGSGLNTGVPATASYITLNIENTQVLNQNLSGNGYVSGFNNTSGGFVASTRTNTSQTTAHLNGVNITSGFPSVPFSVSNIARFGIFMSVNYVVSSGLYSYSGGQNNSRVCFYYIAEGLSITELNRLSNIVTVAQNILSRA